MGNTNRWGFWLFMVVVAFAAALAFWYAPSGFYGLQLKPADITSLMLMVLVITLFVERAQEVILTNWRAHQSEELGLRIVNLELRLERLNVCNPDGQNDDLALRQQLEKLQSEKLAYSAQTRIYALRLGLLMGVVVSFAGVRVIAALVPQSLIVELGIVQQFVYTFVDVILTAGVIAGGSDGVHKMAELYRSFVEAKSVEAKSKSRHKK